MDMSTPSSVRLDLLAILPTTPDPDPDHDPPNDTLTADDHHHHRVVARLQQLRYRSSSKLFRFADHLAMTMPSTADKHVVSHLALQAAHLLAPRATPASLLLAQPHATRACHTRTVSSGRPALDALLGGAGWQPTCLYELAGAAGVGKTELLYSIIAHNILVLPPESTILWIDSALGFSPQRLAAHLVMQMGRPAQQDELGSLLNRVHIAQCPSSDVFFPLTAALHRHPPRLSTTRLLILDSVHAFLAPVIGDSSEQWLFLARQIALQLKLLAHHLAIPVLVTNNASRWNKRNKPALGQAWQYCVDQSLVLFQDEEAKRKIELFKSTHSSVPKSVEVPFMQVIT